MLNSQTNQINQIINKIRSKSKHNSDHCKRFQSPEHVASEVYFRTSD